MIPDKLPAGTSIGEKRLFDVLQRLPDDCIVYYEPVIACRYPDFVAIIPDIGLLILEVKGWLLNDLVKADTHEVAILENGSPKVCKHPIRQARAYMFDLMDRCRSQDDGGCLIEKDGRY